MKAFCEGVIALLRAQQGITGYLVKQIADYLCNQSQWVE